MIGALRASTKPSTQSPPSSVYHPVGQTAQTQGGLSHDPVSRVHENVSILIFKIRIKNKHNNSVYNNEYSLDYIFLYTNSVVKYNFKHFYGGKYLERQKSLGSMKVITWPSLICSIHLY